MRSSELLEILKNVEEGDFTYIDKEFPPVLTDGKGVEIEDVEGKKYRDLSSFFGVAVLGHSPDFIKQEIKKGLLHSMGDLIPSKEKILLLKKISEILGGGWKGILLSDGADAVEACLRTAYLCTGKKEIIAFEGAYHGTSLGALSATYSEKFRGNLIDLLPFKTHFFAFSTSSLNEIEKIAKKGRIGAMIIEPIQGRAGIRIGERDFILGLKEISLKHKILLVFDEIYTGFYKTGHTFAKDFYGIEPDLIALGKSITTAFPLSACMGREKFMNCWGQSSGEASYTFTFSGNPFFSRVGLKTLAEYEKIKAWEKARQIEEWVREGIRKFNIKIKHRGIGILHGFDFQEKYQGYKAFRYFLKKGWITIPSGIKSEVLEIIPPFITEKQTIEDFLKDLSHYLCL